MLHEFLLLDIHINPGLLQELEKLGVTLELKDVGEQEIDGKKIPLPPIILGELGNDPNKKTVLVYGHLDVQPASKVYKNVFSLTFTHQSLVK